MFRVGDILTVIDPSGHGDAEMGDIGEVIFLDDSDKLVTIRTGDGKEVEMFWYRFSLVKKDIKNIREYGIAKWCKKYYV